ncbi:hypothetical protein EV189_2846 [Motilibacter rhizosphaerae]|uniref:Uncharacterized protein n=1 Tax=Motilibacter rhizosphaerae TaxID=598652 RepID=A0A4V2F4F4_9ACTN|nr:hypothetical protein [Motilibacter rhizosphaerae]RZS87417.1 hypothetical protein EV189_2846 [Motilibacter rhizosphaerae]
MTGPAAEVLLTAPGPGGDVTDVLMLEDDVSASAAPSAACC